MLNQDKLRASIAARKATAAEALAPAPPVRADLKLAALSSIAQHCWRGAHWKQPARKPPSCVKEPLKPSHIEQHLNGGDRVGLAPIVPGTDTTRIALLDFDSHKGETPWSEMVAVARRVAAALTARGLRLLIFRSTGGNGIHFYMFWREAQDAHSVRVLLRNALDECGLKNGTKGVKAGEVEAFPKQSKVLENGFGNMWILPFAGESVALDPETFEVDSVPTELPYSEAVDFVGGDPAPQRKPTEYSADVSDLREALSKIHNDAEHSLDYDEWRNVIFGIHDATGGSDEGLALAHEFSARSPKYDAAFLDERVWPYARSREGGITAATIFDMARVADPQSDLAMLDELPESEDSAHTRNPFTAISFDEYVNRPSPEWIIDGVMPQADVLIVYGASGSGKSFVVLDMVAAVAGGGGEWCGRRTKQLRVVYVVAEGAGWFRNRLCAYRERHGTAPADLFFIPAAPDLLDKAQLGLLTKAIKQCGPVGLVVIDTLAQTTPGANENSAEDFGKALSHCRRIAKETGATVLLVHHAGKDLDKGARGWSGLKAAADAQLEVRREGDTEARELRLEKLKDAPDGAVIPFRLESVDIGQDVDGQPLTSCVVTYPDAAVTPPISRVKGSRRSRADGLGGIERLVLKTAHDLIALGGDTVTMEALIDEVVPQIVRDPIKRDRRREYTRDAVERLRDKHRLTWSDDVIGVVGEGQTP